MDYSSFLSKIDFIKNNQLGGLDAQFKLAPKLRLQYSKEKILAKNPKKAAVLALFYPNKNNQTTLLLTKRASYKGTHSAQISFPGGKVEYNDKNLLDTALRETKEEVGVIQSYVKIIREITDVYIPPSNFLATPFLGYLEDTPQFVTNHEVANTIEILVSDLLNDKNLTSVKMSTSYMQNAEVPCFKINDNIIWGATGMMLSEIRELIK